MDLTQLFCDIDNFCHQFEIEYNQQLMTSGIKQRNRAGQLSLSEILTLLIYYHRSEGHKNFKGFYKDYVLNSLKSEFPDLVSYTRFIALIPKAFLPMCAYLNTRKGKITGISFVDSTPLKVCHHRRIHSHQVFKGMAQRGKTSMGWFYGLKLHLIINDQGELLAFEITPGNTDDRIPVPRMAKNLFGKLFGDRGYISKKLLVLLLDQGVELITKVKKNMKKKVLSLLDRLLLRKRSLIETVNDQLKNISQIEHSRHRSPLNAMIHVLAGLVAYTWNPKKPSIQLNFSELECFHQLAPQAKQIGL